MSQQTILKESHPAPGGSTLILGHCRKPDTPNNPDQEHDHLFASLFTPEAMSGPRPPTDWPHLLMECIEAGPEDERTILRCVAYENGRDHEAPLMIRLVDDGTIEIAVNVSESRPSTMENRARYVSLELGDLERLAREREGGLGTLTSFARARMAEVAEAIDGYNDRPDDLSADERRWFDGALDDLDKMSQHLTGLQLCRPGRDGLTPTRLLPPPPGSPPPVDRLHTT